VFDDEDMSRLSAVDARPIFLFEAGEIEWFVPPRIDMWFGKPSLQQRKIGPLKGTE
jgi:hypothetical protein